MQILSMNNHQVSWGKQFKEIFDRGEKNYQSGDRVASSFFSNEETTFLASIGCKPQELFDFIEDQCNYGEPDFETVLQVAAIRNRYLREIQNGIASNVEIPSSQLPAKTKAMDGIPWLPRIIAKARAKMRGELDQNTMYGCGGDRSFLASNGLTLPEFLEIVWKAGDDNQIILEAVRSGLK